MQQQSRRLPWLKTAAAARPLLLLMPLLAVLLAQGAHAADSPLWGTEMASSVGLFRLVDLNAYEFINNVNATRCMHMVNRAGRGGASKVNFVVTHYFVDANNDYVPEYYCYKASATQECTKFDAPAITLFTNLMANCIQYAVDLGLHISFTPHLDDGLNSGSWRNAMRINPLAAYGGYSYLDIMLRPLSLAMNAAMTPQTQVWYALQGEMSRMVTQYPLEHLKLLPYLKSLVLQNGFASYAANVRMGVSTNFNKLCGMEMCQVSDAAGPVFNAAGIQALYAGVDFIGLSAYPRYFGKVTDWEDATRQLEQELKVFGVSLPTLINAAGKELVFSEFGIGGGTDAGGRGPARTVEQAANGPFFGVYGSYTRKVDPWRNYLGDNIIVGTKQYLNTWYANALLWLKRKGGPNYRVDHVFIWNLNSWDIQGVAIESTTKEGTYRSEKVSRAIKNHNLKLRGLEGSDSPGSISPY